MKIINFKKTIAFIVSSFFMLAFATFAYAQSSCSDSAAYSDPKKFWPILQCGYGGRHCCDFNEAAITVNRLLKWFISIAGVVATITAMIAGFKILIHPDNPSEITAGWEMFKKTVWGMLIVLGAWLIVSNAVSFIVKSDSPLRFLKS